MQIARLPRVTVTLSIILAFWFSSAGLAAAQEYIGLDLYDLSAVNLPEQYALVGPAGWVSVSDTGQVAGLGRSISDIDHALLWNSNGSASLLHSNSFGTSQAYGVHGNQQVGWGVSNSGIGGPIQFPHALLWSGTADSVVDLNPTALSGFQKSFALGTDGLHQVGSAAGVSANSHTHAMLWAGTAGSAIDLNPSKLNALDSTAFFVKGQQQVGNMSLAATPTETHAVVWNGSPDTAIDLHPSNINGVTSSIAYGTDGGAHQVGSVSIGLLNSHAVLWSGAAASAIDLTPTNILGYDGTVAYATNASQQVGSGGVVETGLAHALLWSGGPDTAVDLHRFLPADFINSYAFAIDDNGNVFGIASNGGYYHAVKWIPVPEPDSIVSALLLIGCTVAVFRGFGIQRGKL